MESPISATGKFSFPSTVGKESISEPNLISVSGPSLNALEAEKCPGDKILPRYEVVRKAPNENGENEIREFSHLKPPFGEKDTKLSASTIQ